MFRLTFAVAGCTFSSGFQRFCQKHLGLDQTIEAEIYDAKFDKLNPVEEGIRREIAKKGTYETKVLRITVKDRLDPVNNQRTLHAGFALVDGTQLRYMRIQDHLRDMGFGTLFLRRCKVSGFVAPPAKDDPSDWDLPRFANWAKRRGVNPARG